MKTLLINCLVFLLCLICVAIGAEIFLRVNGRYADLVSENLVRSRAIWDRPANKTQKFKHPDLGYNVKIVFNDFQSRNHKGINLKDVEKFKGNIIGVFGDSFAENRRMNDEFTFTSLLNEGLNPDYMVLNFGVSGYGLDQSYIKYLDFKMRHKLDHVIYLFYKNDLRNIYETQLFEFSGNQISAPSAQRVSLWVDVVRKFHVTYLLLDSYAHLKAIGNDHRYSLKNLNDRLMKKLPHNELKAQRARYHDEYADTIVKDYLSERPSEQTLKWAGQFRSLLALWAADVKSHNGKFTIVVVPTEVSTKLAKKLFGDHFGAQTVFLTDYFADGLRDVRFANDGHWNEKGNLRAARAILEWGNHSGIWSVKEKTIGMLTAKTEAAINDLYGH